MSNVGIEDLKEIMEKVIDGKLSREQASDWARDLMEMNDKGSLIFIPYREKKFLWNGILYILGIDLKDSPDSYLHDEENLTDFLVKLKSKNMS